jgi:hypothetical protein
MYWANCPLLTYRGEECLGIKVDLQLRRSRRTARKRDFLRWATYSREAARPKRLCNRNGRRLCQRTHHLQTEISNKVHLNMDINMDDQCSKTINTIPHMISNSSQALLHQLAATMALEVSVNLAFPLRSSLMLHNTSKSTLVRRICV